MGRITDTVKHIIIINVIFFMVCQMPNWSMMMHDLFALYFPKNDKFGVWQLVTHMFMHGGVMHIAFNMLGVWMFGSPLEAQWGRNKFLFFYFSAGLGAAALHILMNYYEFNTAYEALISTGLSTSDISNILATGQYNTSIISQVPQGTLKALYSSYSYPAVGASGALYGVLVAFAFLHPDAKLMMIFLPVPIKAKYFVPLLIGYDLIAGFMGGSSLFGSGGIAHFAHVGGAMAGFVMMWYWKKNSFNQNRWDL